MFAWVEVTRDERGKKEISYSLGQDMTLDGKIAYDGRTGAIELVRLSDGASPQATRDFMEALKERLQREPWGCGQAVCVSYSRDAELLNRWRMDQQASFVRFG
ncbi:hypothetical protein [Selenomonas sp.]|jgi:hypothetical protein|uniref:hypothetical protein n=1 Tax=Selenomonas sp. TaxID=2053611 RepID=UPI0025E7BC73|nr:hypothetical protein [Selenomonas sp.]MCI6085800.1 DUF1439 domain-containing protein [Selenomonas sp.]MCI6285005.1 DUF1439 domain-containing protein [Selenomonas sp.]MDY3298521.1 hypothetical protein [Selenomonas sp.]MDY4415116.1 hypothetical protein [Selenomonas sp.]